MLLIDESALTVKELSSSRIVAEARDLLLGVGVLDRLYRRTLGVNHVACGPGVTSGGWREGRNEATLESSWIKVERHDEYLKRDREFLRMALIPARSASSAGVAFERPLQLESPMAFEETLWRLVSAIRKHGGYVKPLLSFYGKVPTEHLDPGRAAFVEMRIHGRSPAPDDPMQDPTVAGASYFVEILYSPQQDRQQRPPRIRILQVKEKVVVRGLPLRDQSTTLGTASLELRLQLQQEMNAFIRSAVTPLAPSAMDLPPTELIRSLYAFDETVKRLRDKLTATGAYRVQESYPVPAGRPGQADPQSTRIWRLRVARDDGALMAQVFTFVEDFPATFVIELSEKGGRVYVSNAGPSRDLPKRVPADTVAVMQAEVTAAIRDSVSREDPETPAR